MIKLYDLELSGHCHRARLLLSLLQLDYQRITLNPLAGEQHTEAYAAINPFKKIPVLDENGLIVRDSNAILVYLAQKYGPEYYAQDAVEVARIQEWLSVTSNEVSNGPASARIHTLLNHDIDLSETIAKSHDLLAIMDAHLAQREWLALPRITIADISAYGYIARAPEGKVSLSNYPNVRAWLSRIEALEHFDPMVETAA